nr:hypothetical protein [Entomoplasma sp. MP1]
MQNLYNWWSSHVNKSANALLKTLEEPPAHAIFILATTEYSKNHQQSFQDVKSLILKNLTEIH